MSHGNIRNLTMNIFRGPEFKKDAREKFKYAYDLLAETQTVHYRTVNQDGNTIHHYRTAPTIKNLDSFTHNGNHLTHAQKLACLQRSIVAIDAD